MRMKFRRKGREEEAQEEKEEDEEEEEEITWTDIDSRYSGESSTLQRKHIANLLLLYE